MVESKGPVQAQPINAGDKTMQRRQLIATTVASAAFPSLVWSQALEKPQLSIAVGGKNLF